MKVGKKIKRRLDDRIAGYNATMNERSDSKVQMRKDSGGYRKPGSMKNRSR